MWLAGERIGVVNRDGTFNLVIPAEIAGESPEPVRSIAEQHVQYINGIGRLLSPDFRPIAVTDRLFGLSTDGAVINTVMALDSGEIRMKGGVVRGKIGDRMLPDPREAAGVPFLKAASRSRRARDALILIGRDHPSWSELYLAFELVQAEVGGTMHTRGWVSKKRADLFTRTATSYSTLGLEARHGKDRGQPPVSPMSRPDAETMVRGLVRHWLKYLAASDHSLQSG